VTEGVNKFLALDDLSASESDMDLDDTHGSGSESAGDNREPSHKMARVRSVSRDDGDSVPKWSNPDPYTVLPPPSETGKKKDFVQLIRKAKNQAVEKVQTSNAVTANDDFISFGDDDEAEDGEEEDGQKASASAVPPPPPESPPLPPPPPQTSVPHDRPALTGSLNDISKPGMPASASHAMKRSADAAGLPQRPQQAPSTKRKRDQFSGGIIERWLPLPHGVSAPWCRNRDYQAKIMQKDGSDYDKMLML
jgi:non-canonical poly(A) RNA polymerase PAPD5/7